jgi:hypothetical protein
MAVKTPSQSEIEQFFYDIDVLEGYAYNEWLDYMQEEYPNIDAAELYRSKGENIVQGYYHNDEFIQGEPEVTEPLDVDTMQLIQDEVDKEIPLNVPASEELTQGETTAAFLADLRDKSLNPDNYTGLMSPEEESRLLSDEEVMAEDTPIDPLDPMQIGEMIAKYSDDAGVNPMLGMLMAGAVTRNPSTLVKQTPKVSTKNSRILKEKELVNPGKNAIDKVASKVDGGVSTKNSTVLKETTPKVSTKNSTVLKETTPKVSTKNSTVLKEVNPGKTAAIKNANVAKVKSINMTEAQKAMALAASTAGAVGVAAYNGLQGDRDVDGSLITKPVDGGQSTAAGQTGTHEMPDGSIMKDSDMTKDSPEDLPVKSERPGWYQGSTKDGDDGNYWSADFNDQHWNTPAGVKEAIGIWGRPIGNKRS